MSGDEWRAICRLIEGGWAGELDEDDRRTYRVFLDKFAPTVVVAALHKLAESGKPYVPKVPELVAACRDLTETPLPGWAEVYCWLMRGISYAGRGYFDPPDEKTRKGAAFLAVGCHPVVGRFFEVETYERLANIAFDDPEYGLLRQKELHDRWDEFVDVARDRLARDRAMAAVEKRGEIGHLDAAALLDSLRQEGPSALPRTIGA